MFIGLIGPGLVGKEVLSQIAQYQAKQQFPPLKVLGICSSRMRLHGTIQSPIPIDQWSQLLYGTSSTLLPSHFQREESGDVDLFVSELYHLSQHSGLLCIVDCTSSSAVASKYPAWLKQGIHIVTPNKKAFSSDIQLWRDIQQLTKKQQKVYPFCYHESTVGAGLPILSTLKDLIATGDEVIKVEGIFSGTLSYLFNEFSSSSGEDKSFSDMVKKAKDLGYTEPDPRDDLNGLDVGRKVVILARIIGMNISLDELPITNMVPRELRSIENVEEFMLKLPEFDKEFGRMNNDAQANGQVLRYVGVIRNGDEKSCEVKIERYPLSHPFAQLKGSDNVIAFYTKRFKEPLIIQGAGAGAAVTAHGVMSDILQIADRIHYHFK